MKANEVTQSILDYIGGADNIESVSHCATRLRFTIKNKEIIDKDNLSSIKEILGIVDKGGQFQLVMGSAVETYYNALALLLKDKVEVPEKEKKEEKIEKDAKSDKNTILNNVMSYISGAISPTLPVLIGAGMVNALLAIAVLLGLSKEGGTYAAWSTLASVGFTYLPVFVGFCAARKLGTNEYISAFLSLIMIVCFNQQDGMSMFGLTVPNVKYANSIVPVLLMVPVLYLVDRLCMKVIPSAAHFTIKPLIMVIVMVPIILFVFGPVGALIGAGLANMCIWLMDSIGSLAMAVLSALHPITVMFGMHYLFTSVMTNEVAQSGYTFVLCRALAANFAMAGAALAVGVKAKKIENKSVGYSSCVTALLSVTEPALYGCLIRLRKPLISACAAAGISGLFLGLFQVKAYAIASPCLLSLPIFIGGESMMNMVLACAGAAISFVLGFIITYIVGFKEE